MNAIQAQLRPVNIAVFALGGEGGGVLADWIVDVAEHAGYLAQATSVPGVAQRTGATVYYVELFSRSAAEAAGRDPVLALMPVPGDVDVVIASELMEAGRAVERGLVTPERTTLIASTHRVYSIDERIALADRRADPAALQEACRMAAKRLVAFDMEALAEAAGSVISAVLMGALAGSGALAFSRAAFEAAIRRHGVGLDVNLAAFTAGFEAAAGAAVPGTPAGPRAVDPLPAALQLRLEELRSPIGEEAFSLARAGAARLVDYQDADYAREYLERLAPLAGIQWERGDARRRLAPEVARQLALGMAYEDTIRVAELKIRPDRFASVRGEVRLEEGQILEISEFFHPRTEEIADTLPAAFGSWLLRTPWARRVTDRLTRSGKIVRSTSISGYLLLRVIAALKPLRRRSLRFHMEQESLGQWLDAVRELANRDYELAIEFAKSRSLVKGYGETLVRGRAKFQALAAILPRLAGQRNSSATFSGLCRAALADEDGTALNDAIQGLEEMVKT
jgi:indolepyruvate ferredoxin oxidoreductase beta subunit